MEKKKKSEFSKYPVEDKTILIIGYIRQKLGEVDSGLPVYIIPDSSCVANKQHAQHSQCTDNGNQTGEDGTLAFQARQK